MISEFTMRTLRPCALRGLTVPAGSSCRALSPTERLALIFEHGPVAFDVACALLGGEAVEFQDGRRALVDRDLVEGWPALDADLLAAGRGLTQRCERAMRTFRERTRRQRMSDRADEHVAVLRCRRQSGDIVMVCIRESESIAVVGAQRRSGRGRAWPVEVDPTTAISAAAVWLEQRDAEVVGGGEGEAAALIALSAPPKPRHVRVTTTKPRRCGSAGGYPLHSGSVTIAGATDEQIARADAAIRSQDSIKRVVVDRDRQHPSRWRVRHGPNGDGKYSPWGGADAAVVARITSVIANIARGSLGLPQEDD